MGNKNLLRGLRPAHPGRIIKRDVVPALGGNVSKIARDLGVSRAHLYDIMNCEKPITAPIAARMGRYFGNGGEMWLALQGRFDLAEAERSMADVLAAIEPAKILEDA